MTASWPSGVRSAGVAAGIKSDGALDLGMIVADGPVTWAGTFTKNAAAAAPVKWCRSHRGGSVRAIVVNSGNANACTGPAGEAAVDSVVEAAAGAIGCSHEEVLTASTGPIGVQLPPNALVDAIPHALGSLSKSVERFGLAILTTDTRAKVTVHDSSGAAIVGVAKGAAMLAPNMATMLAFLVTDAAIEGEELQAMLEAAVATSFDRISVDACESTNDSVFLLATGRAGAVYGDEFASELTAACGDLAEQMVRDAEGGSKLVRICVAGAVDEAAAVSFGRAIAASALWRAAAHGADPNWGRVLAALGAADRGLDLTRVRLAIGDELLFDKGAPAGSPDSAAKAMAGDDFRVTCVVGDGPGEAVVLSSDITPDYVTMNAFGTT